MDIIMNGQASGDVASQLIACDFNVSTLRPYLKQVGKKMVPCITTNQNGKDVEIVTNANATLRKDQWQAIDTAVIKAAKPRLRAVNDLRSGGLVYNIPNGMGSTVLQTERESDISEAGISMDAIVEGEADRPSYDLINLPLPIISKDFFYTSRQIATAARSGSPLDTTTAELAARRVAESAEKLLTGTFGTYQFGGGTIYGYTNHPTRITKTMTSPVASGWSPLTTVKEVLNMRTQAQQAHHYGPYMLYTSLPWDEFLDDDYSVNKGDLTLRQRLKNIEGITDVRTLDYLSLTDFSMVLVQMTPETVREVVGLDITTVQWVSHGGMRINFKVMAIMVPQLRADKTGNMGLVHGSV